MKKSMTPQWTLRGFNAEGTEVDSTIHNSNFPPAQTDVDLFANRRADVVYVEAVPSFMASVMASEPKPPTAAPTDELNVYAELQAGKLVKFGEHQIYLHPHINTPLSPLYVVEKYEGFEDGEDKYTVHDGYTNIKEAIRAVLDL